MTLQSAGNLTYSVTTFELKDVEKIPETGNIVQVWKYTGDSWQIVMCVFTPILDK